MLLRILGQVQGERLAGASIEETTVDGMTAAEARRSAL